MTTAAPHIEKQQELDEDVRRAWRDYSGELQNVSPEQYEQAEMAAWDALQGQLRRIEHRRSLLSDSTS